MQGILAADGIKDHYVDDIRQALMYHADTSVVTFDWRPNWRRPWPNFSVDHTCVDWDALDSWAAERSFSVFDQKSLVHPKLGGFKSDLEYYQTAQLMQNVNPRSRFSNRKWVDRGYYPWTGNAYCMARRSCVEGG